MPLPDVDRWGSLRWMPDEVLVARAKEGSQPATDYLLRKYRNLVEGKARAYFLVGADHEDVVQEGMIGLFKAIRDFSHDRLSAFRSFAELCVTRQIITAVKTATRQKHSALNTYVSMDGPAADDTSAARCLAETLAETGQCSPEELVLGRHLRTQLHWHIRRDLSDLECQALCRYIQGKSYHEIARDLAREVKQIDNALQRAKKKIIRTLNTGGGATDWPASC